jgi:hypothetical protein
MDIELLVVVGGAFLASFAVGVSGFADALIVSAVWLHVLTPLEVVPLLAATGLVNHVLPLVHLRRSVRWQRLWPFFLGGAAGVPIGAWFLGDLDPGPLKIGIGGFLIACSLFMLFRPNLRPLGGTRRIADGGIGLVGGLLGGLTGLAGVIPTLWSGYRGWSKDDQRAVYESYMFFMNAVILGWLGQRGMVDPSVGRNFLWCLPAAGLGAALGFALYRHLDEQQFKRIVLWLLLISGVALLF